MSRFSLRPAREDDEEQLLALFSDRFGVSRSPALWRWLYRDNPYRPHCALVASDEAGRVVGHFGGLPSLLRVRGELYHAVQHVDFMLAREASQADRQLGNAIMGGFSEQLVPGAFELSVSFPAAGVLRRNCRHFGYRKLADLGWHSLELSRRPRRARRPFCALEPIEGFGEWADGLWHAWAPGVPIATVRDARYLGWRYAACPEPRYRCWRLRDRLTGAARGWAVIRASPQADGSADWELVDLLALGPWEETLLALLERLARREGARRLRLRTLPDTRLARLLLALGYVYERDALAPAVQIYSPHLTLGEATASQWYMTAGDSDRV